MLALTIKLELVLWAPVTVAGALVYHLLERISI